MRLLQTVARWELILLIVSFGVVTLWRLFKSGSFAGLVRSSDGSLSPGRIQLLTLTILAALQYLLATLHDPSHLPALPSYLVAVVGGSQTLYLGSKAWDLLGGKRTNSEEK
jgi:hypothetical protein